MKYKVIKSMAHNFTHSFVSLMNYVDDGYVIDDLRQLARNVDGERVHIQWIPEVEPSDDFPERVRKSIGHYRDWLPRHLESHNLDREVIREFRTDIFLRPSKQIYVEAYVLDDRGKEHICSVAF